MAWRGSGQRRMCPVHERPGERVSAELADLLPARWRRGRGRAGRVGAGIGLGAAAALAGVGDDGGAFSRAVFSRLGLVIILERDASVGTGNLA